MKNALRAPPIAMASIRKTILKYFIRSAPNRARFISAAVEACKNEQMQVSLVRYKAAVLSSYLRSSKSLNAARYISAVAETADQCKNEQIQVSLIEHRAAGLALSAYLRSKGINATEVTGVQRGCSGFAKKLAILAKNAADSGTDYESVKRMSLFLLQEQRINVVEAILESLGGSPKWVESQISLSVLDMSDGGIRNLLKIIDRLNNNGFARRKMWMLFDGNTHLWSSTPEDIDVSIASLKKLGVGKNLTKMVHLCPLSIGRNSQELVDGIAARLQRVGMDPKDMFNLVTLLHRHSDLVLSEEFREKLTVNALHLVTELNHEVGSAKEWFSNHGIDENAFWKLAISNPATVCRSTDMLDGQVNTLMRFGLSHEDAFCILVKYPYRLIWDLNALEAKLKYLVETMGFPVQTLLNCPRYLLFSLERRVKPRHELLVWLEKQGKVEKQTSLRYLVLPEDDFRQIYLNLHEDALQAYTQLLPEKLSQDHTDTESESFEVVKSSKDNNLEQSGDVSSNENLIPEKVDEAPESEIKLAPNLMTEYLQSREADSTGASEEKTQLETEPEVQCTPTFPTNLEDSSHDEIAGNTSNTTGNTRSVPQGDSSKNELAGDTSNTIGTAQPGNIQGTSQGADQKGILGFFRKLFSGF